MGGFLLQSPPRERASPKKEPDFGGLSVNFDKISERELTTDDIVCEVLRSLDRGNAVTPGLTYSPPRYSSQYSPRRYSPPRYLPSSAPLRRPLLGQRRRF